MRGTLIVSCILARAESEKPNKSNLENWDELGIKENSFDSDENDSLLSPGLHHSLVVSNFGKLHLNSHLSWPLSNTPAIQKHRTSWRSCYTAGFSLATRCGMLNTHQTFPSPPFVANNAAQINKIKSSMNSSFVEHLWWEDHLVAPYKGIQDRLGFWIPCRGFRIPKPRIPNSSIKSSKIPQILGIPGLDSLAWHEPCASGKSVYCLCPLKDRGRLFESITKSSALQDG